MIDPAPYYCRGGQVTDSDSVTPNIYNLPVEGDFDTKAYVAELIRQGVGEAMAWHRARMAERDHQKDSARPK